METTRTESEGARANLGLWDATSIIVGIIIGVGIFETPREVFQAAPGPWEAMLMWTVGGVVALIGALCFAELATTYPHSGGEYVYLTRAFGPLVGFMYGWAQLAVIRPASIGAMAFVFAEHARHFIDLPHLPLACAAVLTLTFINLFGASFGANTQNLLTAAKVIGLAGIVVVGLFLSELHIPTTARAPVQPMWFAGGMIVVLWTYAGWHEAAYVAAEVKNSRRNLPLALILGTLGVTVIYLLVNGAILLALGFEDARTQSAITILRGTTGKAVNLMIMISALGAINGMIFTTARIGTAFGKDHRLFKSLSHWSSRGAPVRALAIQAVINLGYLIGAAIVTGGLTKEGLEFWIQLTAAVFYFFFLLSGIALFVLRNKDKDLPRPFVTPLYPILPIAFCGSCACLLVASVCISPDLSLFGLLVLLAGLPFYYMPQKRKKIRIDAGEPSLVGAGPPGALP